MRLARQGILAVTVLLLLPGCERALGPRNVSYMAWGKPGRSIGSFLQPRAIGVKDQEVYVIDTTGRVQVFNFEGGFIRRWSTPDSKRGTPTALTFDRTGRVLIPDTHYSQILEYTPQGELLRQWGSYGTGPQEFIYPTGIAQSADGGYYITEYGMGAERLHVFDADRHFARQWGEQGNDENGLSRAMALVIDEDGTIYVADMANHRVKCFDDEGRLLRIIGGAGTQPGRLKFPYDLAIAADGTLFVCEYGNHRLSRFSRNGEFIACYGRPGRGLGEFDGPRGLAVSEDGFVFIADTDNHRVQRMELKELR